MFLYCGWYFDVVVDILLCMEVNFSVNFKTLASLMKSAFVGVWILYEGETKVKAVFKLRGNRDREELVHCAALTMPIEEFSHVQYSALPSVEWQQRGRKHGPSFVRVHNRRTAWRSAVYLGRRSETCGNSPSYFGSVWTEHHESTKGLWVGGKV